MARSTTSVPQHSNPHVAAILAFAASGKAGNEPRTPNEWVQAAVAAKALPAQAKDTSSGLGKAIGRNLRGFIGRLTGNGVGRGRTYPPTTATELLRLAGYSTKAVEAKDDKARTTAITKAGETWGKARARVGRATSQSEAPAPKSQSKSRKSPAKSPAPAEQVPAGASQGEEGGNE